MRRIVHLSDIHFGAVDQAVVERVVETVNELSPDLVVVSGDLTQRAKSREFIEARAFLDRLPTPQIVVPGNHDVPLFNIYKRFVNPLKNYKRYITDEPFPFYSDDEVAVIGINTARSFTIKDGRINREQVSEILEKLDGLDEKLTKIVVTHHPFDLPEHFDDGDIVDRANEAMPIIAESGADIFLSGHLHVSHITSTAKRYRLALDRAALIIQAGTATSTRGRGEPNSFNLIEIEHSVLKVKRYDCTVAADGFALATTEHFSQTVLGWSRI